MKLYLVPNDPEHTTLVSPNGVAQYQVTTTQAHGLGAGSVLHIRRPGESEGDSFVADVAWGKWGAHSVIRSNMFDGTMEELEVRRFLFKRGRCLIATTRCFLGSDDEEYRWKHVKGVGHILTHAISDVEIARMEHDVVDEGFFAGERRWCLRILPTTLDIDMIVATFIIMEKKRRDRVAVEHSGLEEDPCEGGVAEVGGMGMA